MSGPPEVARIVRAGIVAAVLSGIPSTLWAFHKGDDPLEATAAAGSLLLPHETDRRVLIVAALPVHLALSVGWTAVLAVALPGRKPVLEGALGGLLIGFVDLSVVGRRWPRIRKLPVPPQLADHIAFGAISMGVLARNVDGRERD